MSETEGDYEGLVKKISLYAAKKIPDDVLWQIQGALKSAGWNHSQRAVKELSQRETCPANLFGFFENRLRAYFIEDQNYEDTKKTWRVSTSDCVSPIEWELFFAIIREMLLWVRFDLVQYQDINAHFTDQYERLPGNDAKMRENFLGDYLNKLMSERQSRINKRMEENRKKGGMINEPAGSADPLQTDTIKDFTV